MNSPRTAGNATVQWFEGDIFVGEQHLYFAGASTGGESFSGYWPHRALLCPVCGTLWARAINQYDFEYAPKVRDAWVPVTRECVKHGGGLLLDMRDMYTLNHCSPALLLRELTLLLSQQP